MVKFWERYKARKQLEVARSEYNRAKIYLEGVELSTQGESDCTGFGWTPYSDEQWKKEARKRLEEAKRQLEEAEEANKEI